MATIVLKSTSGKEFEIPSNELKQLQKEAIQAYNDSIELDKLTAGKSELKKWQIEMQLQKAGKLKFGSIFQVTKKQLVVSYKRNLINGLFEGHNFQLQVIETFNGVPAGTILKW